MQQYLSLARTRSAADHAMFARIKLDRANLIRGQFGSRYQPGAHQSALHICSKLYWQKASYRRFALTAFRSPQLFPICLLRLFVVTGHPDLTSPSKA